MFTSKARTKKNVPSAPFQFSDFVAPPETSMESIASISWDRTKPLDLLQAEKAFELAEREGAAEYVPQLFREAKISLAQAQAYGEHTRRTKEILDFSRRAVSASSEAIQTTLRRKEREELDRQIDERRLEMETLEGRASAAEATAAAAATELDEAASALAEARLEKEAADAALAEAGLQQEAASAAIAESQLQLSQLDSERVGLEASVASLNATAEQLRKEREELASRLEAALSEVADTQSSARGFVVNLPDILFDLNQATLKSEAKVVIAKLSGILLIMPELNLRIEGHTDATGSEEHNQGLSEQRAGSVEVFLTEQGLAADRIVAVGYGEARPVADNDTAEGRKKNRRVEIVISEGVVQEAEG